LICIIISKRIYCSYNKYFYTDFNLVESNITHLAGKNNPAYKLVWIDPEGQYTIKTMQIGTIINHKLYVIQYYAELEKALTLVA
jgi:hypothetical protein